MVQTSKKGPNADISKSCDRWKTLAGGGALDQGLSGATPKSYPGPGNPIANLNLNLILEPQVGKSEFQSRIFCQDHI